MSNEQSKNPPAKGPEGKVELKSGASAPTAPKTGTLKPAAPAPTAAPVVPGPMPRLFRAIDWLAFGVTTLIVFAVYWYTLAPDLTLQDSGELAVASMYAGVPHPPGYPVWTIYSWFFTLLPFSNIAYRVALSSAVAGALSAGMIALMVSRGSSMMMEGIAALKDIDRRWENALCVVSGLVAGLLIGFNGFMWSQAVIVEVYTLSVLSLTGVLVCVLRWTYAPHQYRYLYLAFFLFGICFNNHQSLLVTALGLEVAVLAVQPRLGRDLFFWNTVVWIGGLIGRGMGFITTLKGNDPLFFIYNVIGVLSLGTWLYLLWRTKIRALEMARDLAMIASLACVGVVLGTITHYVNFFYYADSTTLKTAQFVMFNLLTLGCIGVFVWLMLKTRHMGHHWLYALICGGMWTLGAAFYFYMPLASMSNPPLNWGYPRTVTGFFHAFTRGQYEKINPTTDLGRFINQVGMYLEGAMEEFNLVYLLLGLLVFLFYKQMQKRERAWIMGLTATYLCLSVFLLILLNPSPDRQSRDLNKVFFTASHVMIAMGAGYGLALVGAFMALHYDLARRWLLRGLAAATVIALVGVIGTYTTVREVFVGFFDRLAEPGGILNFFNLFGWFFGLIPPYAADPMVRLTVWFGLILAVGGFLVVYLFRTRPHLELLLGLWCLMPLYPFFAHWADNEQRGHLFGYWFGHDMFTPPFKAPDGTLSYDPKLRAELMKQPGGHLIYPEMDEHTVLFGGTDPGRFNPTYMIYCESFIPASKKPHDPLFDRRDVYLITQNALADGTYLSYIRAHYNRSAQIDPYFFSELLRGPEEVRLNVETNILARMMLPIDRFFFDLGARIEKRRRAGSSFFKESDFVDLPGLVAKLKQGQPTAELAQYLRNHLAPNTRALLDGPADKTLARALAADLNRLLDNEYEWNRRLPEWRQEYAALTNQLAAWQTEKKTNTSAFVRAEKRRAELEQQLAAADRLIPLYKPERFAGVTFSDHVQRFIAENPQLSSRIRLNRLLLEAAFPKELAKSLGGVYPDREIRTPSNDDSQKAFQDYLADAQRRLALNQLKPGEDVRVIDNKVQVSGQVAVMAINGLLTKVIFDANPHHEFYVEESFPLDWMYPYLTPFGIIMKINRQPLADLSEEILQRDRKFWSDYSVRLVGDWITDATPVSELCAFAERVYLNRNYKGFQGDPKFVRDNDGQKAFSKLRSSIAGVYAWRYADYGAKLQEVQRRLTAADTPAADRPALQNEFNRLMTQRQRMMREAEFAFKQAYAYCPYSPEAIFRYINLLVTEQRIEDAYQLARTSRKLDPYNPQLEGLLGQLAQWRAAQVTGARPPTPASDLSQLEAQFRAQPNNPQLAAQLVQTLLSQQQNDRALAVLDQVVAGPTTDANLLLFAAQKFYELNQLPRVEQALARLVKVSPDNPEAWYDLAGLQAMHHKEAEALTSLTEALRRSAERRKRDPNAPNLASNALTDPRFNALRTKPEFQKALAPEQPPGG